MSKSPQARILSDREFAIEHTFHAPAAKVFAAYTDPKMVPLWWGIPGAITVESMDVRPGGSYRFLHRARGREMVFSGTYLEVNPVTRLVYTYAIEGEGNEVTTTVELEERDGVTHGVMTNRFASKEARDMAAKYGAEAGARATWKQLEQVLART